MNNAEHTAAAFIQPLVFAAYIAVAVFFPACNSVTSRISPENDTRTIDQLIAYLGKSGLKIDKIYRNVRYQAILASDGVVMKINGTKTEFYLYDVNVDYQRKKLEKIKKHGYIMILGYKVPAVTNGRFVMLTYSDTPEMTNIIHVFKKFK